MFGGLYSILVFLLNKKYHFIFKGKDFLRGTRGMTASEIDKETLEK